MFLASVHIAAYSYHSCRMVAEAAAGKSKHHQVRTAHRAKRYDSSPTPRPGSVNGQNGAEKTHAEKAPPASAA